MIAEYKDGGWKDVGALKFGRYNHNAIMLGPTIFVVGGKGGQRGRLVYNKTHENLYRNDKIKIHVGYRG